MNIQIINPKTGRKVNIDSTLGKFILKNYYDSQQGSGLFDKKCKKRLEICSQAYNYKYIENKRLKKKLKMYEQKIIDMENTIYDQQTTISMLDELIIEIKENLSNTK